MQWVVVRREYRNEGRIDCNRVGENDLLAVNRPMRECIARLVCRVCFGNIQFVVFFNRSARMRFAFALEGVIADMPAIYVDLIERLVAFAIYYEPSDIISRLQVGHHFACNFFRLRIIGKQPPCATIAYADSRRKIEALRCVGNLARNRLYLVFVDDFRAELKAFRRGYLATAVSLAPLRRKRHIFGNDIADERPFFALKIPTVKQKTVFYGVFGLACLAEVLYFLRFGFGRAALRVEYHRMRFYDGKISVCKVNEPLFLCAFVAEFFFVEFIGGFAVFSVCAVLTLFSADTAERDRFAFGQINGKVVIFV